VGNLARIEINLPVKFTFSTPIPIRIGDINRGSHVGHVTLLAILEEARAQFLVALGYGEQVTINTGIGFIIGDLGIIYKSQVRYGQSIQVEIAATEFKEKSFDLVYRISDSTSGIEIARAKTALLFFDYAKQRVIPVTEEFKKLCIP
jgi:acyl-CoA thioester hydrolase